ncbi:MAG: hydrogen peroxide-inducible genes activator [Planctomycetota bacterium]|nr:MAG: hydrogen peroxide-inducible genes activator [Planctomycetota bacterium]
MTASKVTIRQLEAFLTLAEVGHFRRAALRMGISQPTLTSQIAALERGLKVRLFERSPAGTLVSVKGRDLIQDARRVVEAHRALLDRASSSPEGPAGTYRLGITPTLGPYLLPHILPDLHRRYAGLKLFVREDAPRDLEHDLLAGAHDLALTPTPLEATGQLSVVPLFREPLLLVTSADHRLAHQRRVLPEDLAGEPVLTLQEHHHFHRQVEQLCHRLGARLLRDYEGTSLDTLRHMVVMGMGVAFLPALYVESEIHQPDVLHVTQIHGERIERIHALVWRNSVPHPELFRQLSADIRDTVRTRLAGLVETVDDGA